MAPFGMLQGFDANGVPVMMPAAYPTGSQGACSRVFVMLESLP